MKRKEKVELIMDSAERCARHYGDVQWYNGYAAAAPAAKAKCDALAEGPNAELRAARNRLKRLCERLLPQRRSRSRRA